MESRLIRQLAKRFLPYRVQKWLKGRIQNQRTASDIKLAHVRNRWFESNQPGGLATVGNYAIRINDGPNFYVLYKDIFALRIYHFDAERPDPFILDCGSNIGMSILYFKDRYPKARIIGFEPDPSILPYLRENISRNALEDVNIVEAGVSASPMTLTFYSDAKYGGALSEHVTQTADVKTYEVSCVRLTDYLTEPVDFLKMNIEGAEWEVLEDCGEKLRLIREMVIEYHHLPGLPRTLHKILTLLDEQGFEYLINDFDPETSPEVSPPFRLTPESRYFLLIYAKRID